MVLDFGCHSPLCRTSRHSTYDSPSTTMMAMVKLTILKGSTCGKSHRAWRGAGLRTEYSSALSSLAGRRSHRRRPWLDSQPRRWVAWSPNGAFCGNARGHQAIASAVLRWPSWRGKLEKLHRNLWSRRYTAWEGGVDNATRLAAGGGRHGDATVLHAVRN